MAKPIHFFFTQLYLYFTVASCKFTTTSLVYFIVASLRIVKPLCTNISDPLLVVIHYRGGEAGQRLRGPKLTMKFEK